MGENNLRELFSLSERIVISGSCWNNDDSSFWTVVSITTYTRLHQSNVCTQMLFYCKIEGGGIICNTPPNALHYTSL